MTGVADLGAVAGARSSGRTAPRLAVFTSHPIQYQAPFFRALATSGRVQPTVYFGSRHGVDVTLDRGFGTAFRWDVPLLDGYTHAFLPNVARAPDVSRFAGVRVADAAHVLRRGDHDAVLVLGWHTRAHVQMLRAAWALGLPVLVRGESTLQRSGVPGMRGAARHALWHPLRQRLYAAAFARVDAFLVIGSRNREYYRSFGVPEAKLHWAPYGVDNDRFALAPAERSRARTRVRDTCGIGPATVVFASSAKLIERKRPFDLVDAVALLRGQGVDAAALFIGDGEERTAVERRAALAGISRSVHIAGFINQAEMPAWYAAADALVLPSDARETWGLVVNEAMAAGLPVVVSDAAGCSADLVVHGSNGFVYPCGDLAALTSALEQIAGLGSGGRAAYGAASRTIVARFGIDVAAGATVGAVESLVRRDRGSSHS